MTGSHPERSEGESLALQNQPLRDGQGDTQADRWSVQCLNCGAALHGAFCGACGQRAIPPHPSVRELAGDAVSELSGWDGKFAETIRTLVRKPGELTRQWLEGRRARFISPMRLYLTFSLIYFVISATAPKAITKDGKTVYFGARYGVTQTPADDQSRPERVGAAAATSLQSRGLGLSQAQRDSALAEIAEAPAFMQPMLRKAVDDPTAMQGAMARLMPRVMFVLLPLFAGILAMFYRGRHYPEHLYFAIHLHAFFFLALTLANLLKFTGLFYVIVVAQIGAFAWGLGYAILAARRVYGGSAARTIAKGAAIAILYATVAAPILLATVFLAAAVG